MSKGLENFLPFIVPANSDYPWGDIKDDTGSGDGTDVDRANHADYHQTWRKILALGYISPNGLPDNVTNGYQYIDALNKVYKRSNGVKTISANSVITTADFNKLIYVSGTSGNITIQLPSSAGLQDGHSVIVYNIGSFRVDVSFGGSDFVMGGTEITLVQANDFCELILDKPNLNWVFSYSKITPLAPSFVTPTLLNSWTALAGNTPQYINQNGKVTLRGGVTRSSFSGNIFQLPAPSAIRRIPCAAFNGTTTIANVLVVDTAGNASMQLLAGGPPVEVYLEGLSYYI